MSSSRKNLLLNTFKVNLGCSSCRKPKLSHVYNPKPKPKPKKRASSQSMNYHASSSSSPWAWDKDMDETTATTTTTTTTNQTFSPYMDMDYEDRTYVKKSSRSTGKGLGRTGGKGVAVEKDSEDPYLDFRHSMLQMILENEIYSKEDLRELLNCFLQLNSPYHHGIIVRAFTEIWNGVFSNF